MANNIVAIVGRPNVGKSTIFNRFVNERVSIVDDVPGVTRDRIYDKVEWLSRSFSIIDTGGIQLDDEPFSVEIKAQVDIAIEEADIILFVVDGKTGITNEDKLIGRLLRKSNKEVFVVVNKIDDIALINNIYDFFELGFGDPMAVSGLHGIGVGDVLDRIVHSLDFESKSEKNDTLSFCVIGQPNVGKSSLVNSMLNQDRVIVSEIEGTTRDAINTPFTVNKKKYTIIDTAGIRKKGKVYENVEKYSVIRSLTAIEKSDVVLFLIDGEKGIRDQDKHVAGYAFNARKPIIILYNKWDLVNKEDNPFDELTKKIREEFAYLSFAPILFISASTKQNIHRLIPLIDEVHENSIRRIDTSVINDVVLDAQQFNRPKPQNGKMLRIYYSSQVSIAPPTFVMFVNDPSLMHFSYKRYLENRIREAFDFTGTPINVIIRKKT